MKESKVRKHPFPYYRRSKWGWQIFLKILENGVTQKKELEKLKDSEAGERITGKMLWETVKHLMEENTIEEVPSKGRGSAYDLTPKFRTKEFDQVIYLNSMRELDTFSDTINFQHTIYGLPKFEDMTETQQRVTLHSIRQIDDALRILKIVNDIPMENIALLSTSPVNRTKVVRENIELVLNAMFEDNFAFYKKFKKRLSLGNLSSIEKIILTGRTCRDGLWVKSELSKLKFENHKKLKEIFSENKIKFMLDLMKELVSEHLDIDSSEMVQFIIYKGFSEGGLWYDKNKRDFYEIANTIVNSIDGKCFSSLIWDERTNKIRELILENTNTPFTLKDETIDEYGLSELILYIDAKAYFEKIRPFEKVNLDKVTLVL